MFLFEKKHLKAVSNKANRIWSFCVSNNRKGMVKQTYESFPSIEAIFFKVHESHGANKKTVYDSQ